MIRSIEFTLTVSRCLNCSFCPQDKLSAAYKSDKRRMTAEDFVTILSKLPKTVRCDFSGFSECYLHPDAHKFIQMAITGGYETHIYSTLVGLRQRSVEALREYPPSYFRVHVPDKTGLKLADDMWIRQHELFLESGVPATYMSMSELTDAVGKHLRGKNIEVELPAMLSRASNLWQHRSIEGRPMRCSMNRWFNNVVLPNGDVVGCCMIYDLSVILGNLLRQPYEEIQSAAEEWKSRTEAKASAPCAACEWGVPA